ncbi:hypothetical protein L3X38_037066 [Prunus dulcis]|uniref:Uncharacterized protein n=1 Tax=Prunus dulcis TaxID=3755 RepID=A0AAD4V3W9_PRUDU|nr:hypothetical protein L3X38_037066 [Prunus dulcis]
MGNLANKLNKAYAGEVKQTLKAKNPNWSEIDVAGGWQVLNMGFDGMAHHSLVHAARRKDKDMDLLMDL